MITGNGRALTGAFFLLASLVLPAVATAQVGSIVGTVLDAETGETIIGANVRIAGTTQGSTTDLEGGYEIRNVTPGTHTLEFSYIGYAAQTVTGVTVEAGRSTRVDLTLRAEALGLDEVTVEARALRDNEATLLRDRQKALAVSDAISAEAISRSGASSAADAMNRVTGASVVGGRYVSVRGLGDRYTTAQLNGAELPSADPDRRSVQLDLIPSGLLDNIVTVKTFTPDKPGNFSGGAVDINTKDFPDARLFTVSGSVTANTQVMGAQVLGYEGSATDWLGFDNGVRALPEGMAEASLPSFQTARADAAAARTLDLFSRSFSGVMAPRRQSGNLGRSLSLSAGDRLRFGTQQIGVIASLSYSQGASYYGDGAQNRWELQGSSREVDALRSDQLLRDERGDVETTWGAFGTLTYQPHPNHRVSGTVFSSQTGESTARYLSGKWETELPGDPIFETRSLLYTERNLRTFQFKGRHVLGRRWTPTVSWNVSLARTSQNEPDLRFFANDFTYLDAGGATTSKRGEAVDTVYNINRTLYDLPTRFFRSLTETSDTYDLQLRAGVFTVGGYLQASERRFRERRFSYEYVPNQVGNPNGLFAYDGNPDAFFGPQQVGLTDSLTVGARTRYFFGNYIADYSNPRNNYDGDQQIAAGFAMANLSITPRLRVVVGARYETTRLDVASQDTTVAPGRIDRGDLLPALSAVYSLTDNANLRLSYGRTLARPTFREVGPFRSFDYVGSRDRIGNPDLDRTLIDNVDARYEWFARPGEIYAVSAFYKRLKNPIEVVFRPEDRFFSWDNVEAGQVYGLEVELRRQFALRAGHLVQAGVNASLVRSAVDADSTEQRLLLEDDPNARLTRPLFGQSPYLVNADLTYTREASGTALSLYYNVFGARLATVVTGATPDVYEQPRHSLDLSLSQRLRGRISVKASAKNVLDARYRETITYRDQEYVWRDRETGRQFSLGIRLSL